MSCRLSFMLPTVLAGTVRRGRHQTSGEAELSITVDRGDLVRIDAPSRAAVFEHAIVFLRQHALRGKGPCSPSQPIVIPATLFTHTDEPVSSGREDLWIAVGADIVIARDVFARSRPERIEPAEVVAPA
jgi:hypothetical protein